MGSGSLTLGQSGWGEVLTTNPHLVPMLKKELRYTSTSIPIWRFIARSELDLMIFDVSRKFIHSHSVNVRSSSAENLQKYSDTG
jgi:hypothetical protein